MTKQPPSSDEPEPGPGPFTPFEMEEQKEREPTGAATMGIPPASEPDFAGRSKAVPVLAVGVAVGLVVGVLVILLGGDLWPF